MGEKRERQKVKQRGETFFYSNPFIFAAVNPGREQHFAVSSPPENSRVQYLQQECHMIHKIGCVCISYNA